MRMVECARCGYDIRGMGKRDERDRYVHQRCPTPAERGVDAIPDVPQRTEPLKIRSSVRAFCRKDAHLLCSGGQYETGAARAFICSCDCHADS